MLRLIVDGKITHQVSSGADVVTSLAFSERHKVVITGSATGFIRVFEFPLTGAFREYPVHSASVARLRLSPNDEFLFSAGEDGCLFAFMVSSLAAAASSSDSPKAGSAAGGGGAAPQASDESRFLDLTLAGQHWMSDIFAEQRATQAKMEQVA
jgi:hypothetical protein